MKRNRRDAPHSRGRYEYGLPEPEEGCSLLTWLIMFIVVLLVLLMAGAGLWYIHPEVFANTPLARVLGVSPGHRFQPVKTADTAFQRVKTANTQGVKAAGTFYKGCPIPVFTLKRRDMISVKHEGHMSSDEVQVRKFHPTFNEDWIKLKKKLQNEELMRKIANAGGTYHDTATGQEYRYGGVTVELLPQVECGWALQLMGRRGAQIAKKYDVVRVTNVTPNGHDGMSFSVKPLQGSRDSTVSHTITGLEKRDAFVEMLNTAIVEATQARDYWIANPRRRLGDFRFQGDRPIGHLWEEIQEPETSYL